MKLHQHFLNLMIQTNLIHAAYLTGVKKLIFLGSSCIYPKHSKQPIKEEYLLSGPLENTNLAYAVAKIAGLIMCESYNRQYNKETIDFRVLMPTNLYGDGDNYLRKSGTGLDIKAASFDLNAGSGKLVIGSATPSMEFYFQKISNKITWTQLKNRFGDARQGASSCHCYPQHSYRPSRYQANPDRQKRT